MGTKFIELSGAFGRANTSWREKGKEGAFENVTNKFLGILFLVIFAIADEGKF